MKSSKIAFLIIGIIISTTLFTTLAFYIKNNRISPNNKEITVLAIINYGTLIPENQEEYSVSISNGSTALEVFAKVADLDLLNYSFGVYIRGVNGYTEQSPHYWAFYYYNHDSQMWVYSEVGVHGYYTVQNDRIKLQYTG
ncbi:MAG: hypothetical protein KAS63_00575 [Candidatus Heimdallarchaeota archaeon]|nr:hypothetical protein [Candidatus Heimdallarchaeota archaeon]MCK4953837.1 hypothetical protein [Candidatus Heimdallarchaeota archaeon]